MKHWNKIRNLILTLAVMMSSVFVLNAQTAEVQAEYTSYDELYPMSCDAFSVATLNSDGTFTEVSCTSDYNAAKQQMWALGDAGVIRHKASGSATKIIDMSAGVVYSYPQRNGSNTANIYQYMDGSGKSTYVTYHREMRFEGVYAWYGNGNGMVRVMLNGFDGYVNLSDVDLIPMAAVTNDIPLWLGGNDITPAEEYPFKTHVQQAYYCVEQNGNYRDLVYHCFNGWGGPTSWPSEWVFTIGPAADWMTTGSTYYSSDGTTYYTDRNYTNVAGVYYPYYQFLPLRTKSNIPASVLDSFLAVKANGRTSAMTGKGQVFVDAGNEYGMNSLLVFAIGCLESGYGTSNFALNRNNLFGIAAYDSNPDMATYFSSVDQCIREEAGIFLRGYTDINDWRFFGPQLGNKGSGVNVKYAADSYWGMKMAAIAYEVDKYANGYNGNLTDYNTTSLAVVSNDNNINVLKSAGGDALYATTYGSAYQKNHMVTVLSGVGDYYTIQSTSYLTGGNVASVKGLGLMDYDWNSNIGYVRKSDVTLVNTAVINTAGTTPTGDPVNKVSSVQWTDGKLVLSGDTYRPGIYVNDANSASVSVTVLDDRFNEAAKAEVTSALNGNDDMKWTASTDVSTLANGTYFIDSSIIYSALTDYNIDGFTNASGTALPDDYTFKGRTYHLAADADNGALSLTINAMSCGVSASYDAETDSCVCDSGYENWKSGEGCTLIPEPEPTDQPESTDAEMQLGVLKAEYADDGKTLQVTGVSFFEGMAAKSGDSSVAAQVSLVNIAGKEKAYDFETTMVDMPGQINMYDGVDYTRIGWTASLDTSTLAEGDYYLQVTLTNGNVVQSRQLLSSSKSMNLETIKPGDYNVRFFPNSLANFRLEISVNHSQVDYSDVNKPYLRTSFYGNESLVLDGSVLKVDGLAFMFGAETGAANKPGYSFFLEGEDGQQYPVDGAGRACTVDYAKLLEYQNDISDACFTVSIDLAELPAGEYRLYVQASTTQSDGTVYKDVYDIYAASSRSDTSSEKDGRTYSMKMSDVRNTYVIMISE
ncbi:MAG: glucosaminidase domain-containing protein [Bulleidia sp.]|nr:glucosaminidase domain-containing protein [Bulleidia sp.]